MTELSDIENRRVFLVASQNLKLIDYLTDRIQKHISQATVFNSRDGGDAIFKIENSPPHVILVDGDLPKIDGYGIADKLIKNSKYPDISIIIMSRIPDQEAFVDEVVTGKIQFLTDASDESRLNFCIARALNRLADKKTHGYKMRFLVSGYVLFNEGEAGTSAYIVKSGELTASKKINNDQVVIGTIQPGEFVGEMAHINNELRFATITAKTDCELIEIPFGTLDTILFSKPAWSKALFLTLSKRLRKAFDT